MTKNRKNIALLVFSVLLCVSVLICSVDYLTGSNVASAKENLSHNIQDETNSNLEYVEVFNPDGTMQKMLLPAIVDEEKQPSERASVPAFKEHKLLDSGKPDSESLVMTIMGDGFTESEQTAFLNAAQTAIDNLLGDPEKGIEGFSPFNLFRSCFTVYAIEVISNESGVSRDSEPNNGHIVDNYFGSSFYSGSDKKDAIERALVVTKTSRVEELVKPNSSMTAILCNSTRHGGTGGKYAVLSLASDYSETLKHELGHSFGKLADEYYYLKDGPFEGYEAPNMTATNDPSQVKWKDWLGYKGVDIYPYSSEVNTSDPGFDPTAYNWYKPCSNCAMKVSSIDFCPVCEAALISKMEQRVGALFDTTQINDSGIRIDKVNIPLSGNLVLPERIYAKQIVEIGAFAFANQTEITKLRLPNTLIKIGNNAFENCTALTDVTVERELSDITSLGSEAFLNCNNLTRINVPINRIADYKNEAYWSTYKTLIHPLPSTYTAIYLNDSSNINKTVTLSPKWNKIYKLNVLDPITYLITSSSTQNVKVKLYDENMNLLVESSDSQQTTITRALAIGTYYYSVEYSDASSSGSIKTTIVKKHIHSFNSNYEWINYTSHSVSCSCGSTITQEHVISETSIMGSGSFTTCLLCGGQVKVFDTLLGGLANQIQVVTKNGSMILPNGIVVLADADREAYFNETLVFYDKYKLPVA